jgi:hypothetical protein
MRSFCLPYFMIVCCVENLTIVCVTAQSMVNEFLCEQVLREDLFDNKFGWNSSKCAIHLYDSGDVVDCIDRLTNMQRKSKQ